MYFKKVIWVQMSGGYFQYVFETKLFFYKCYITSFEYIQNYL